MKNRNLREFITEQSVQQRKQEDRVNFVLNRPQTMDLIVCMSRFKQIREQIPIFNMDFFHSYSSLSAQKRNEKKDFPKEESQEHSQNHFLFQTLNLFSLCYRSWLQL